MKKELQKLIAQLILVLKYPNTSLSPKPIWIFDKPLFRKILLFFLFSIGGVSITNAQATLWQEDFNRYTNGTTISETPPRWSTQFSGPGVFSVQSGSFLIENSRAEGEWTSEVIDISSVNYSEISFDISGRTNNFSHWLIGNSGPDYLRCYYKINGGPEVLFFEHQSSTQDDNFDKPLSKVLKGNTVQIIIRAYTDQSRYLFGIFPFDDYYNIDDITVTEVKTFYSLANGNWNDGNKWSVQPFSHSNRQPAGEVPTANEGAIVGNGNNITINIDNAGLSFLEVIDNGTLTMSGRSLSMYRGGGITLKDGGKIRNNGTIVFRDNADTDMTIDTPDGLTVGSVTLQNGLKLNIKGTGNGTISGNIQFSSANNTIDLNLPLTINGNISSSSNTNQLINRSTMNWGGQTASTFRLFTNHIGSVFNYSRGGNQSIITPEDAYHHLILSGSGTKTTGNNFTINGNLDITGSATLSYNNTISLAGDFNNQRNSTGTLTGNGTFIFNGSNHQTYSSPSALTFSNLGLHKTGGNLILGRNMISSGTATVRNSNRIEATGNFELTFANLSFPQAGSILDLSVNTTLSGNITLGASNSQIINRRILTHNGTFPTNHVFTLTNSENATINWRNTNALNNNLRLFTNHTGSEFNYSRGNTQNIIVPQDAYHTLILSGSNNKSLTGTTQIHHLEIQGSAALVRGGNSLRISGDFINNSSNANPFQGAGTVSFNGTSNQQYSSNRDLTIPSIAIDKSGGKLVIGRQIVVSTNMTFTNGIVETTSTNLLIFNNNATQTGSNNNSYVEGPVRKVGTQNQSFRFPIGKESVYAPIEISNLSASATFQAEYFHNSFHQTNTDSGLKHVSGREYWDLNRISGSGNAFVTLYFMDPERSEIIDLATEDLVVAHFDGTKWEPLGGTKTTNSVRTTTRVTSFSPFTFGSISGVNPLPVEFVSFTGTNHNNGNLLKWQTATEHNNDYFSVEKSKDGKEWSACGRVAGNGDSFTMLSYSYLDQQAAYGVTYYRLKQVDFNGDYDYSPIISVNNSNIPKFSAERAYPNPTKGELMVRYTTPEYGQITLTIQNLQGQTIVRNVLNAEAGSHTIEMDIADLANGLYLLIIQQNQNQVVERIVKQ